MGGAARRTRKYSGKLKLEYPGVVLTEKERFWTRSKFAVAAKVLPKKPAFWSLKIWRGSRWLLLPVEIAAFYRALRG